MALERLNDGFYVTEGTRNIMLSPHALSYQRYRIPSLNALRGEEADLAARLIEAAVLHSQWVAMSVRMLYDMFDAENKIEMEDNAFNVREYRRHTGLRGLLNSARAAWNREEFIYTPRQEAPISLLRSREAALAFHINNMVQRDYLEAVADDTANEPLIIGPTPTLVTTIYKEQMALDKAYRK